MSNSVLINIIGGQEYSPGDKDDIKFVTGGEFEKIDKNYYISYNESEITGLKGVSTTIKVEEDENRVTLIRKGPLNHEMIFEKGTRHHSIYDTGEGILTMIVNTNSIENNLTESGGRLFLDYTLEINSEVLSRNSILIEVQKIQH